MKKIYYGFYNIKNCSIRTDISNMKYLNRRSLIIEKYYANNIIEIDDYNEETGEMEKRLVTSEKYSNQCIVTFAFNFQKEEFCKTLRENGLKYIRVESSVYVSLNLIIKILNYTIGIINYSYELISQEVTNGNRIYDKEKNKWFIEFTTTTEVKVKFFNVPYTKTYTRNFKIIEENQQYIEKISYTEALKSLFKEFVLYTENNEWKIKQFPKVKN